MKSQRGIRKAVKKDFLRTEACFSWYYDSLLEDLKKSVFIYPENEEVEKWIRKFYKVIEENETVNYTGRIYEEADKLPEERKISW